MLTLRLFYHHSLNLLFPPQCLMCSAMVSRFGALCNDCWGNVQFITEPYCDACGFPFEYSLGQGALCAECIQVRPLYARARAAVQYDAHSRLLVMALKYHDQQQLTFHYARWMAQAGAQLLSVSDVIVPVPLHRWRFVKRRYNQAALLAEALGKISGIAYVPDALARVRATNPQTGLTRNERQENLKGAFAINPHHAEYIAGKHALVIDDVMTTGTTLMQCAKALLNAGAAEVNVLTLARRV